MMAEVMTDATKGNVILDHKCERTNVVNELDLPILCMGCKDMVIAASSDGILISDKERSGYMKPYVEKINRQAMYAEKSWGTFQIIDMQPGSMTVKVFLRQGQQMSYHSHEHRIESYTVVSGNGRAIIDGIKQELTAGSMFKVDAGSKHTIVASTNMSIIETQIGEDLSVEDKVKY